MPLDQSFDAYIERRRLDARKPAAERGPIEIPPPRDRTGQTERAHVMAVDETNIVDAEPYRLLVVRNDRGEHVAKWVVVPSTTDGAQAVTYRLTGRLVGWDHTPAGRKHSRTLAFEEVEQLPDFEIPDLSGAPAAIADVQAHFRRLSPSSADDSKAAEAWSLFQYDIQDRALSYLDGRDLSYPLSPLCPLARQMLARDLVEKLDHIDLYPSSDGQDRTRDTDRRYDVLRAQGLSEYAAAKKLVTNDVRDGHEAVKSIQDSLRKRFDKRAGQPRQPSTAEQRTIITQVVADCLERLHQFARSRLATDILNDRLTLWADRAWRRRLIERGRHIAAFELAVLDIANALERNLSATVEQSVRDLLDDSRRQLRRDRRKKSAERREAR